MKRWLHLACLALLLAVTPAAFAQDAGFDEQRIAFIWHKLSGEPLDLRELAEKSEIVQRSTGFDKPAAIEQELARLQALYDGVDPATEFTITTNEHIGEYDHQRGEFPVQGFEAGRYLSFQYPGRGFPSREYRLVFANPGAARAIPMPDTDQARTFDTLLRQHYRNVQNRIRFRVIGKGDPEGVVTGQRVVRAQLLASTLLDRDGKVIHDPDLSVPQADAVPAVTFDPARSDAAGLRVGVKSDDMVKTLARLYGEPSHHEFKAPDGNGFAGQLRAENGRCHAIAGSHDRRRFAPGVACVQAWFDGDGVVRHLRVQRVFPYHRSPDEFRKALLAKYGPTSQGGGSGRGNASWNWGEPVTFQRGNGEVPVQRHPLTAYWSQESGWSVSGGTVPVLLTIELLDAAWFASRTP